MLKYWLWLANCPGLGDGTRLALLRHFQNPEAIYRADSEALRVVPGMTAKGLDALADKSLEEAEAIWKTCQQKNIRILTLPDYPDRLKNIPNPPVVLYGRGTLPDLDNLPAIGVVGTRQCSAYGLSAAARLGYQIGRCGGIVVSGMARGIDGAAMEGCLKARQPVVGVLGCGVDVVYPACNRELFRSTQDFGCLLSQFSPGTPPMRGNFPRRNRIISGLSCGVLVVEAPEISGALITAREALDQGRDVFVVPGNIDNPCCIGSNRLLRDGASPATCGWDILCEYEHRFPGRIHPENGEPDFPAMSYQTGENPPVKLGQKPKTTRNHRVPAEKPEKKEIDKGSAAPYSGLNASASLTPEQKAVLDALQDGPRLVDDVIAQCGLRTGAFLAVLTMLEVKGLIRRLPGKRICLRGE